MGLIALSVSFQSREPLRKGGSCSSASFLSCFLPSQVVLSALIFLVHPLGDEVVLDRVPLLLAAVVPPLAFGGSWGAGWGRAGNTSGRTPACPPCPPASPCTHRRACVAAPAQRPGRSRSDSQASSKDGRIWLKPSVLRSVSVLNVRGWRAILSWLIMGASPLAVVPILCHDGSITNRVY